MIGGHGLIFGLYALVVPVWVALSFWTARRAEAWRFTPRWHGALVPVFRLFFLATLPFETLLADRPFIAPVFVIGSLATVTWLLWRFWYLYRAPDLLPRADSVQYNTAYLANLIALALACHSFVCVAIMINVSLPMLLVRERCARRTPDPAGNGDPVGAPAR
ncbi:hypothetical protein [Halofilum ochraceum]|uniref:hypothetical protein n=1 Tax=Halofilum ochraceum TaxID=1611323 RepID=UPI00082DBD20|nr:hypothetical protein [Halofilum ochraceum]